MLPFLFLLAVVPEASVNAAPKHTVTHTDARICYELIDEVGRRVFSVENRTSVRGESDSDREASFNTPEGLTFVWRDQIHPETREHPRYLRASLESLAENARIELEMEYGSDAHTVVRCGMAKLDFVNKEGAIEVNVKAADLVAFREAVPPGLRDFCELLVRAGQVVQPPSGPVRDLITGLAAPKGSRADSARTVRWTKENKHSTVTRREVPVLDEAPDASMVQPGDETRAARVGREKIN